MEIRPEQIKDRIENSEQIADYCFIQMIHNLEPETLCSTAPFPDNYYR